MAATNERVLTKMAEAFNELANDVNSRSAPPRLSLSKFCRACRLLSPLIGCMGIAFRFADMEFSAKVDRLTKASESIDTIEALIDLDIARNAGKSSGSNSRNLIRANRSVDLVRIMCEQILAQRGNSITGPILTAYGQVFGPYHSLAIKTAVRAAVLTLPTKARLLRKLKENEASARVSMQKFVIASSAVIQYINNLFHSTEYGDELLGMI
ncbi:accelerated cell death 11-like [Rhododendron vialii]|uniref:accelerated cell death 11-like n=1 Tax=Rhododendron vialii TaxID=182163 RepID=UPI00265FEF88|nr:accelerated cell death 11-like [Rhododendron vialii]